MNIAKRNNSGNLCLGALDSVIAMQILKNIVSYFKDDGYLLTFDYLLKD